MAKVKEMLCSSRSIYVHGISFLVHTNASFMCTENIVHSLQQESSFVPLPGLSGCA